MKHYECTLSVINYEVDGYKYLRDGDGYYTLDEEQTAFLQKMLPMLLKSDFYGIERLASEYSAVPF